MASEPFTTMFIMPQPAESDERGGLSVVPMEAVESGVLRELLLFCHPGERCETSHLQEVLQVAEMFEFWEVARRVMKERLRIPHVAPRVAPYMLKAAEDKFRGDEDGMLAAEYVMKFPPKNDAERDIVIGLHMISQGDLDNVLKYHKKCGEEALLVGSPNYGHYKWVPEKYTDNYGWFDDDHGSHTNCDRGGNHYFHEADKNDKFMTRRWWLAYVLGVADELESNPDPSIVVGERFDAALELGSRCAVCKRDLKTRLARFAGVYAGELYRVLTEVRVIPPNSVFLRVTVKI